MEAASDGGRTEFRAVWGKGEDIGGRQGGLGKEFSKITGGLSNGSG